MPFDIVWNDNNKIPDDTSIWDIVSFSICCLGTFILLLFIILLSLKTSYPPVKGLNIRLLVIQSFAGIIHIWSTFISNEHLNNFRGNDMFNCAFWNFFLQYLCGFGIWFACIINRIITYGYLFSKSRRMKKDKMRFWKGILMSSLILPTTIICSIVFITNGCELDEERGTCITEVRWKISMLIILVFDIIIMISLINTITKGIRIGFFNDYIPHKHVVIFGCIVLCTNGVINLGGYLNDTLGRSIFTSLVAILHIFTISRIATYRIWKSLKKDNEYTEKYLQSILSPSMPFDIKKEGVELRGIFGYKSFTEIKNRQELWLHFLQCCNHYSFTSEQRKILGFENEAIVPKLLLDCFTNLVVWREGFDTNGIQFHKTWAKTSFISLIERWLTEGGERYCGFPPDLKDKLIDISKKDQITELSFQPVEHWIVGILENNFGDFYMAKDLFDFSDGESENGSLANEDKWSLLIESDLVTENRYKNVSKGYSFSDRQTSEGYSFNVKESQTNKKKHNNNNSNMDGTISQTLNDEIS